MSTEEESILDQEVVTFRSPAKAAKKSLGDKVNWVASTPKARGDAKTAYQAENKEVFGSFGFMAEDLSDVWLRKVVDNLVKPLVEDGDDEERKLMEEFEAFYQVRSCAADTCRAVLLRAFDLAGVPASPTPYTDADKLERVAIEVAGRAVDKKILKVSGYCQVVGIRCG